MENSISLSLLISIATIFSSVVGAYLTLKTTLVKHEEKIDSIKSELDDIKEKRESDFTEIRNDLKGIYKGINEIAIKVSVLEERIKK